MTERERLTDILKEIKYFHRKHGLKVHLATQVSEFGLEQIVDVLIDNGVIVPPCKVGDKAAVRALCECVITTPCYEECRNICPFEDDCECEECGDNERIFDTKVSAIYNNGNGWYIEFEHLIIQARFTDIGTSFFVGENAHEQAVAYNKALAEGSGE